MTEAAKIDSGSKLLKFAELYGSPEYSALVDEAAREYLDRRTAWPHNKGYLKAGGKWYPNPDEKCCVCNSIRRPSCAYQNSLLKHATSMFHICDKIGVLEADVCARVKELKKTDAA